MNSPLPVEAHNSSNILGHPDIFTPDLDQLEHHFPARPAGPFDIFLSYSHGDQALATRLADDLQARGLRVWKDGQQVSPGEMVLTAMEKGLTQSACVCLLATAKSLSSAMVGLEKAFAVQQAAEGKCKFILLLPDGEEVSLEAHPLLKQRLYVKLPDPITAKEEWHQRLDFLTCHGVLGSPVAFYPLPFGPCSKPPTREQGAWARLLAAGGKLGLTFESPQAGRVYRMRRSTTAILREGKRLVVVANLFDPTDYSGVKQPLHETYLNFVTELRARTRSNPWKVVFLLYHDSAAWKSKLGRQILAEAPDLEGFFTLHSDIASDEDFARALSDMWRKQVQPEFLNSWRGTS